MIAIFRYFNKPLLLATMRLFATLLALTLISGAFIRSAQAAIVYTGSASGANNALPTNATAGTLTIIKPAGTVAGQALIASIAARPHNMTVTVPPGWFAMTVTDQPSGGVSTLPGGMTLLTYYHIVAVVEPASYDWTFANTAGSGASYGGSAVGGILAFSGIDTSTGNPINVWSAKLTPSGLTHSTTAITPTVTNTMIVSSISYLSGNSFNNPTGIAGITERLDQRAPAAANAIGTTLQMSTAPWPTAISTGVAQADATADADTGVGHLMALKPSDIDIAISMTRSGVLTPGGTASYTLNTINNGIKPEPGAITIVMTLPSELTYVATGSGGSGWVCSAAGQVVTCVRAGALAAGASAAALVINVNVSAIASGTITNIATVSGTGGDGNTVNNTAIDSYTIVGAASFVALEVGSVNPWVVATRKPLYTKLVNTVFKMDIAATKNDGSLETNYVVAGGGNKYVLVELFDDTNPVLCASYAAPLTSQIVTFVAPGAGGSGRTTTGNFNLAKAYRKVRARVKECLTSACVSFTATAPGCSEDFTVRPKSISSVFSTIATGGTAANADAAGLSTTNAPVIKAGTGFNLTADTATIGYNGLPKIDASLVEWSTPPAGGRPWSPGTGAGTLTGLFTSQASAASGNGAFGNAFTYDEVGYFRFKALGVYDNSYPADSNDLILGDCIVNSVANVLDASTDPAAFGRYGCNFGNTAVTSYFGRFIPHHFSMASASMPAACVAGGFSYMDQPFALSSTIEARNAGDSITPNYSGTFGKGIVTPQAENANSGVDLAARLSGLGTPVWTGGSYPFIATKFTRQLVPDGSYDSLAIGLSASDEAGQVLLVSRDMAATNISCNSDPLGTSTGTCTAKTVVTTKIRYGRLRMQNAYGAESLDLPISVIAQYWNGSGWIQNVDDSCTTIVAPTSGTGLTFFPEVAATVKGNHLSAAETTSSVSGTNILVGGNAKFKLSKPGAGNNGYVDITFAAPVWLQFPWKSAANTNPTARATFGIYKNANEFIYLREIH